MKGSGRVRQIWTIAAVGFFVVWGGLAGAIIALDRDATLQGSRDRTRSMARLLLAHGESALEEANKVLVAAQPLVANWTPGDAAEGQRIHRALKDLMAGSPHIGAVGYVDKTGAPLVNSWAYPPQPINVAGQLFFKLQAQQPRDLLILGDIRPGLVSGKDRFTVSRALRRTDGTFGGLLVASVYNDFFEKLHRETANWPGAQTGLFVSDVPPEANALTRNQAAQQLSPDIIAQIHHAMSLEPGGTLVAGHGANTQIVSWQRADKFERLHSIATQPVADALEPWRWRALAIAVAALVSFGCFCGLAWFSIKAAEAREAESFKDALAREVHHRVKNSLQIVMSVLDLRARRSGAPEIQAILTDSVRQVGAIAALHEMMQATGSLDEADICELISLLCANLERGSGRKILHERSGALAIAGSQAGNVAIMVNELVTNALKHARSQVEVACGREGDDLVIRVSDDGEGLPAGFDPGESSRFGLKTIQRLCRQLGGRLSWRNAGPGAEFELRLPIRRLTES